MSPPANVPEGFLCKKCPMQPIVALELVVNRGIFCYTQGI